jgi:mono/diheme cytochrome c family protein
MRGFPELGSTQIANVADYLLAQSVSSTTLPGATTTTTAPRSGAAVYAASCALCHGANGGNLRGHSLNLSQIVSATTDGVGTMGGYAGKLSSAEINTVSQYVLSLGANAGVTTTTAPPGSPVSGADLYMQHCSACHGLHGEGGPGGPVAGTPLSRSAIIEVTTEGAGGMPAYKSQLSGVEIAAVADHVVKMGGKEPEPGDGATARIDGSVIPPELAEGHALFSEFCASCHGANGEGGLGGPVADTGLTLAELDEIVRNGTGAMPGYEDRMTDDEIEALVAFSAALASGRSFDPTTTTSRPGEETLAAELPVVVPVTESVETEGASPALYAAIAMGVLVAAGLVYFWVRTARRLFG